MKNKAVCPKCSKPNQLTLSSFNGRIQIVCGACGQWWSIGEIEHTPYFFGGEKELNGPYELRKCEFPNCFGPVNYGKFCDQHQTPQTYSEGKEMNVPDERLRAAWDEYCKTRQRWDATTDKWVACEQIALRFAAKVYDSAMREAAGWIRANCQVDTGDGIYGDADRYTEEEIIRAIHERLALKGERCSNG